MLCDFVFPVMESVLWHQKSIALVASVVLVFYHLVVRPLWLSPLRNVPGPYWHRVSSIPRLYAKLQNLWVRKVHNLHQLYGNVVVVAPGEVSCNGDAKFISDIYVHNMPKLAYYRNFRAHGHDNLFSTVENDRHLAYKRLVLCLYLKSAVFGRGATREILRTNVSRLISQIYTSSVELRLELRLELKGHQKGRNEGWLAGAGIDIYLLFGAMAMDVISAFELGLNNGTDLLVHPHKRHILLAYREQAENLFWTTSVPWLLRFLSNLSGAPDLVMKSHLHLFQEAEKRDVPATTTFETLKRNGLYGKQAYSFLSDSIIAGHETTALSLTYLCYELLRPVNNHRQETLQLELQAAFGKPATLNDIIDNLEKIDRLPYLDALLCENLRVHTSGPGSLPRTCPEPYKVKVETAGTATSVILPAGTTISCQLYLLHRVSKIFPDPESWIPERWLQQEGESEADIKARIATMRRYMLMFGKGVRMCLGMNLALIEIKMAIANMYWHFGSSICPEWCEITSYDKDTKVGRSIRLGSGTLISNSDEEKMKMVDSETTRPYCNECWLEWRSLNVAD